MSYAKVERNTISKTERWGDLPEFQGQYSISTLGRIYSNRFHRFLDAQIDRCGYKVITIRKKHYMVHRLIANTFMGLDLDSKLEINHKDGNKLNNDISNLEIVTRQENMNHAWDTGLLKNTLFIPKTKKGSISPCILRLLFFFDEFMHVSRADFERTTGVARGIFSSKTKTPRQSTISKITKHYPINQDWLLTGSGEMTTNK